MKDKIAAFTERLGRTYLGLFALIEGPELEPTIFHSHFLSARAAAASAPHLRDLMQGDILDVGAGTGFGKRLIHPSANYYPTDIPGGRNRLDASITRQGIVLAKECSVYAIDFETDRFDGCMALSLFEHLDDPRRAIAEISRVVKPGGHIVLQVPFNFPVHGYPMDYWRWTQEGIRLFLQQNGMEVLRCDRQGKTIHAIALNCNFFVRYGAFLVDYKMTRPRMIAHALLRPFMFPIFAFINVAALLLGLLDRSASSPILICAVARNSKDH